MAAPTNTTNMAKEAFSDRSLLHSGMSGENIETDLQDALYKQLLLQVSGFLCPVQVPAYLIKLKFGSSQ